MYRFVSVRIQKYLFLLEARESRTLNEVIQLVRYKSISTRYHSLWEFAQEVKINLNNFRLTLSNLSIPPFSKINKTITRILKEVLRITITKTSIPYRTTEIIKDNWSLIPGIQRTIFIRLAIHNSSKNLQDLANRLGNAERFGMFISNGDYKKVIDKLSAKLNFTFKRGHQIPNQLYRYLLVEP